MFGRLSLVVIAAARIESLCISSNFPCASGLDPSSQASM